MCLFIFIYLAILYFFSTKGDLACGCLVRAVDGSCLWKHGYLQNINYTPVTLQTKDQINSDHLGCLDYWDSHVGWSSQPALCNCLWMCFAAHLKGQLWWTGLCNVMRIQDSNIKSFSLENWGILKKQRLKQTWWCLKALKLAELEALPGFHPDLKPVPGQRVEMQESEPCWRCWADSMGPSYTAG